MLRLTCATSNAHKLAEFSRAASRDLLVEGCLPLDCPETGNSYEENALQKATCYHSQVGSEWLFADDSGLEVDALGGRPGIHSARFAGPDADDDANNRLLLERLRNVPTAGRGARFVCVIVLLRDGAHFATFRGEVEGRVLRNRSGRQGFGYDPLFHFPPLGKSFGRLAPEVKWQHSHRGKAFRAMLESLRPFV